MAEQVEKALAAFMGPRDVAELFDVPLQTVYAWRSTHRGQGPIGFKVGRHVRYSREEIEKFVADRMAKAAA